MMKKSLGLRIVLNVLIGIFMLAGALAAPALTSTVRAASGTVTFLQATTGSDGKSETITGDITTGGYDKASLAVTYGTGLTLNYSAQATIVGTNGDGTDSFTATIPNLSPATYNYDMTDNNTVTFAGSKGTFTIAAAGTAAGGGAVSGGSTNPGDLNIQFQLNNPLGSTQTLPDFLTKLLNAAILILIPVVTLMLLYSGFLFVQAQGNTEKLGEAKKALLYTVIGAAIVLGAVGWAAAIKSTVSQF